MENSNNEQAAKLAGSLDIRWRLQGLLRKLDLTVEVVINKLAGIQAGFHPLRYPRILAEFQPARIPVQEESSLERR